MVPHLITALNGPINELEQRILESLPAIERWFRLEWMEHTPPFYTSVDVRNAGFKLAPVDTNLFPGGFNNQALGGPGLVSDWVSATVSSNGIWEQFLIQAKAVGVTVVWSGVVSFVAFKIVDMVVGLRVSEEEEREGLDIASDGVTA